MYVKAANTTNNSVSTSSVFIASSFPSPKRTTRLSLQYSQLITESFYHKRRIRTSVCFSFYISKSGKRPLFTQLIILVTSLVARFLPSSLSFQFSRLVLLSSAGQGITSI